MEKLHSIIAFGELLWDLLPTEKRPGGAPANVLYHLSQLHHSTVLISAVGDDQLGKELLSYLENHSLNTRFIQINEAPTGTVDVELEAGQPSYTITESVAWDAIQWSDEIQRVTSSADAFIFGSLSQRSLSNRALLQNIFSHLPPDCPRLFDVNIREPFITSEIIQTSLEETTILKLNQEELPYVLQSLELPSTHSEIDDCIQILFKKNIELIALTKGEEGSVLISPNEHHVLAAEKSFSGDTIGAGDAFSAMLLHHYLRGTSLEHMHEEANKLAGWVASQDGAMPPYTHVAL